LRNGVLAVGASWLVASGPPQANADLWAFLVGLDSRGRRVATVVAAVIGFAMLRALWPDEPDSNPPIDEPEGPASRVQPPTPVTATEHVQPGQSAPARILNDVGLAIGSPAPDFVLPDIEGRPHDFNSLRAGDTPVLLIFSSPFCESCHALMPKLPGLAAEHADALRLVVISRGTVQQNLAKMKGSFTLPVLLQQDYEVAEAYDCRSTPAAVLVSADGEIRSLLAVGGPAIVQLIATSVHPRVTS